MDAVTDSGGRVTRSLRKRVGSIDSDASTSRPGTPQQATKLTAITELNSPRRMTRRNSTSGTPLIATPSKRGTAAANATPERVLTPAKRSRRLSSSILEVNTTPLPTKNAAACATVAEEHEAVSSKEKRVTRSLSKSPNEINCTPPTTDRRRKPGPKSKTRKYLTEDNSSDVEVIEVEDSESIHISFSGEKRNKVIDLSNENEDKSVKNKELAAKNKTATIEIEENDDDQDLTDSPRKRTSPRLRKSLIENKIDEKSVSARKQKSENVTPVRTSIMRKSTAPNSESSIGNPIMKKDITTSEKALPSSSALEKKPMEIQNSIKKSDATAKDQTNSNGNNSLKDSETKDVAKSEEALPSTPALKKKLMENPISIKNEKQNSIKSITTPKSKIKSDVTTNSMELQSKDIEKSEDSLPNTPTLENKSMKNPNSTKTTTPSAMNQTQSDVKSILMDTEAEDVVISENDLPSTPKKTRNQNISKSENILPSTPALENNAMEKLNSTKDETKSDVDGNLKASQIEDITKSEDILQSTPALEKKSMEEKYSKEKSAHSAKNQTISGGKSDSKYLQSEDTLPKTPALVKNEMAKKSILSKEQSVTEAKNDSEKAAGASKDILSGTTQALHDISATKMDSINQNSAVSVNAKDSESTENVNTKMEKSLNENEESVDLPKDNEKEAVKNVSSSSSTTSTNCTPTKNKVNILEVITIPSSSNNATTSSLSKDSIKSNNLSTKSVTFTPHSPDDGDDVAKAVYPRTPAQTKTKSFINNDRELNNAEEDDDDDMQQDSDNSQTKLKYDKSVNKKLAYNSIMEIDDDDNDDEHASFSCEDDKEIPAKSDTPLRRFEKSNVLKRVQSSTPLQQCDASNSTSRILSSPNQESKPKQQQSEHQKKKETPKLIKWCNPSVKGLSENGCKLDAVEVPKLQLNDETIEIVEETSDNKAKKSNGRLFEMEPNAEEDEGDQHINIPNDADVEVIGSMYEDDEDEELAENEEPYQQRNEFVDDEAMEVDGYQSGDSMDSEERREIIENEIPADAESIGSHTTDDEEDHEEDGENDSFIVSDNEEDNLLLEYSDDDENISAADEDKSKEKDKKYKRIQRPTDSSSDEEISHDDSAQDAALNKSAMVNEVKNSSKLSDTAQLLHEEEEEGNKDSDQDDAANQSDNDNNNLSRKNILRELNKSDRFNKSVRDLDPDVDISPETIKANSKSEDDDADNHFGQHETKQSHKRYSEGDTLRKHKRELKSLRKSMISDSSDSSSSDDEAESSRLSRSLMINSKKSKKEKLLARKSLNIKAKQQQNEVDSEVEVSMGDVSEEKMHGKKKHTEVSHLGEVSITTEEDVGNENKTEICKSKKKKNSSKSSDGLSVSFGRLEKKSNKKGETRRSFTIGVSLKNAEIETAITEIKTKQEEFSSNNDSDRSKSEQSNDEEQRKQQEDEEFSGQESENDNEEDHENAFSDTEHVVLAENLVENLKQMPLGNPLIRTRRQSLALPTNPNMEICSGSNSNKKSKRKSMAAALGNTSDYKPSQSFVDSVELQKRTMEKQSSKRKRLSKSFCGTADSMDNSTVDLDVCHLHKRSKLAIDNSNSEDNFDSMENINSSLAVVASKAAMIKNSSTPCDKDSIVNVSHNSKMKRILNRCDEILEAANRAKLESKLNYKKSKVRVSKKKSKKAAKRAHQPPSSTESSPNEKDQEEVLLAADEHKKEKTKAALAKALKASAKIIVGKKKAKQIEAMQFLKEKRLPIDILEAVDAVEAKAKSLKKKGERHSDEENIRTGVNTAIPSTITTTTTSGAFTEMPVSTMKAKKKKTEVIRLPTGNVTVEPITPKKKKILTCNGIAFRESPITPHPTGFTVRPIFGNYDHQLAEGMYQRQAQHPKERKRKRNICDEFEQQPSCSTSRAQWTQSGLFIEERIPTPAVSNKKQHKYFTDDGVAGNYNNNNINFKQAALMRGDIKRTTTRDVLQRKERRHVYY